MQRYYHTHWVFVLSITRVPEPTRYDVHNVPRSARDKSRSAVTPLARSQLPLLMTHGEDLDAYLNQDLRPLYVNVHNRKKDSPEVGMRRAAARPHVPSAPSRTQGVNPSRSSSVVMQELRNSCYCTWRKQMFKTTQKRAELLNEISSQNNAVPTSYLR